jgi:hypothetical protein
MAIQLSSVIASDQEAITQDFSLQSVALDKLGEHASPVVVLHNFRVHGSPFPPHPHAGFSTVTYVFQDSEGSLRSRDSLGSDLVTGPGGVVWTEAGSGLIHHELPAVIGRELHGLQLFVNVSSRNRLATPQVMQLKSSEVPEWRSEGGDRVRVVVGSFEGVSSPLVPAEPFTLLDVKLWSEIAFDLPNAHNALAYVLEGELLVRAEGHEQRVKAEHSVALYGSGGRVTFQDLDAADFIIVSGAEIREPMVTQGPFIMNELRQIEAAFARYQAGRMGHLPPLSNRICSVHS